MPVTIYPTNLKYKNSNGQFQSATAIKGDSGEGIVVQVSGTTPTIICEDNHRYICGEVLSLNITPPANGVCEIIFESGSTATLLTAPNTIKWPEWFNPNSLETSATYQFKISNGLANVAIWPDEGLTGDTRVRIQKMLGVYEAPWELIREDTFTNETEADHIIEADANGETLELTDVALLFSMPKQESESKWAGSGVIAMRIQTGTSARTLSLECNGFTQAANGSAHIASAHMRQTGNSIEVYRAGSATESNSGGLGYRVTAGLYGLYDTATDRMFFSLTRQIVYVDRLTIKSVTGTGHYKLYGKRKWQ